MKTFNKKGDTGETSLLFGVRVSKSDPRPEAYGTIDEAVSALGVARAFCASEVNGVIRAIQKELFLVGAELATPVEAYPQLVAGGTLITPAMVERIEQLIVEFESRTKMPEAFVMPGATKGSAMLDLARTIIRRAERRVVGLKESGMVMNQELTAYLNRLADLIYTLARFEEQHQEKE
jgi:cob(I)alamin adenosyltransferase